MIKPLLFLPGPMQVPGPIRAAADRPMFNHRSDEMDRLIAKLETGCRPLFGTSGDVLFFASSGTGAMESAIVNLTSAGDEVIVFDGGAFAHRWTEIAAAYGLQVHAIDVDWTIGATLHDVERALTAHPNARVIFLTWSESSTGVLLELEEIGRLIRSQNRILVADAVSGLAVSPMQMDDWCIDAVVAGSQKGLMLPPGLGLVAVGPRAWEKAAAATNPRYYWDWKRYKKAVPFTPATTILFQLEAALGEVESQGHERFFLRKTYVADKIRALIKSSGFGIYAVRPGNGVTCAVPESGFDIEGLIRRLERDFGIQIAGNLGRLKGMTFRIGHVGHVADDELEYFIQSFKRCLN